MAKQKRIGMIALGAVSFLLFGAPSFAVTVNPGDYVKLEYAPNNPHNSSYAGGAFKATDSGSSWITSCLEINEYFQPGSTYKVDTVGLYAVGGGAGKANPTGTTSTAPPVAGKDPISYQTAFLYDAFLHHPTALPGGAYSGTGAQQKSLQIAFWYLENEITSGNSLYTGNALARSYIAYALSYTGSNTFGVKVFNPVTVYHGGVVMNQSMLFQEYVSAPEAGALLLFGTGLVRLVGYRRVRRMK